MLSGKVAVVTGSTVGIGYAIAERMCAEGAKVVITSRRQHNVDAAVEKLKSQGYDVVGQVCHVGKDSDRKALVAKAVSAYGAIDILVHNAAVSPHMGATMDTTEQTIDKIMQVNLKAPFFLTKEALPHLRKGGHVLLISSVGAFLPFTMLGFYSISKTAMLALTKLMAKELAGDGIRVNCIAPGVIKTRFSTPMWETEESEALSAERSFLGRVGTPDECAGMAAFLSSKDASYITGETFMITGGSDSRL